MPIEHFDDFVRDQQAKREEKTAYKTELYVPHFFDFCDKTSPGEITTDDVRAWVQTISSKFADSTAETQYYFVSGFFTWLFDEGKILADPTASITISDYVDRGATLYKKGLAAKEGVVYFGEEKFQELIENVPEPRLRNELLLKTLWQTGIRASELCHLRMGDVDRDERRLTIKTAKRKSHIRHVWYKSNLDTLMYQWMEVNRGSYPPANNGPYFFISNRSNPLSTHRPNRIVKKAANNAGIQSTVGTTADGNELKKFHAHAFRHSFAVHSVRNGMDIYTLKELLGHASIETTEKYLRFKDETLKDKMMAYSPE